MAQLTLEKDDVVRVVSPFACPACELLEDFRCAWDTAMQHAAQLPSELIREIESVMGAMEAPDYTCFDPSVLDRPKWQQVRTLARRALEEIGFTVLDAVPAVETSEGIWEGGRVNVKPQPADG